MNWDVFISHASEDKESVARPLSNLLAGNGLRVWLDENELRLGDSLRAKIDQGLAQSHYGVVILSQAFFAKDWPQRELSALAALEDLERKVILPVWHGIDKQVVARYSPLLADKIAVSTDRGLVQVATAILQVVIPLRAAELGLVLDNFYPEDRKLFEDLLIVFNRPAFRGTFLWQTDPEPFKRAMGITLKALDTGILTDKQGVELRRIEPITQIKDEKLRAAMQQVATRLKRTDNLITRHQEINDEAEKAVIRREIDDERDEMIRTLNRIWGCFGIPQLPIPTEVKDSTNVWEQ